MLSSKYLQLTLFNEEKDSTRNHVSPDDSTEHYPLRNLLVMGQSDMTTSQHCLTKATSSHFLPVAYSRSSSRASTTICKTRAGDLSAWIIMENEWEGFSSDSDSWSGMLLDIKIKEERLFSGSIGLSTLKLSPQRSGNWNKNLLLFAQEAC